jgi:ABC-type amino acid transport system permease subunit
MYTLNGVAREYYQGLPFAFSVELVENVDLGNRTLYLKRTTFSPMAFLIDWLIFSCAVFIVENTYTYVKKKVRPSVLEIYRKAHETAIEKLIVKKRWAHRATVLSLLFTIIYIAVGMILASIILFCLGLASLLITLLVGRIAGLIEHEIDTLKISQLKAKGESSPIEKD